jgi:diguanylate cyclase (GGDEF)-like protein/PAS domain S-box-containing protein
MDDRDTAASGALAPCEAPRLGPERLAALAFDRVDEGLFVLDTRGVFVRVNPALSTLTGYSAAELLGKTARTLGRGQADSALVADMWAELEATGHFEGEIRDRTKSGEPLPAWFALGRLTDDEGRAVGFVGRLSPLTDREAAEDRARAIAQHDPLTRLPNRALLADRLSQAFAAAQRGGTKVGVLFLDLDHFKDVNDALGHHAGDALLREVARRLKGAVRAADTVARLGGDEFVVVLSDVRASSVVGGVAEKIARALARPFALGAREVTVTASIGVSVYPDDAGSPEDVLRDADAAMYEVKQRGRNGWRFFTHEVEARAAEALALEHDLAAAIEHGELEVHFQPEIELATGRVVALEALLRWRRRGEAPLPASRFLPLAEERGLGAALGEIALASACSAARALQAEATRGGVRVALNVGLHEVRQPHFARHVGDVAAAAGVAPRDVEIEIAETTLLREPERAAELVAEAAALGFGFVVDDFGTGFASLAQLRRLPFRKLKMDGSLLRGAPTDADAAAIAASILGVAASLGLEASAEQVETVAELDFLRRHGCRLAQGTLLAPALPLADAAHLVRRGRVDLPA